jgi:uncharacterized protein
MKTSQSTLAERLDRIKAGADACVTRHIDRHGRNKDWGSVAWDMWDMWGAKASVTQLSPDDRDGGRTQLAVIQPTPFCNIQCSYCYLPDKNNKRVMDDATLRLALSRIFESPFTRSAINLVWHSGEPLVVPVTFYEKALRHIAELNVGGVRVLNSIQTNGTLLTAEWCEFFKANAFEVGVSIDGPRRLHDARRKDRAGRGTHEATVRGIRLLQEHGVEFSVIAVLGADALNAPDEIWHFFQDLGVRRICLNVEEIEGANSTSTLTGADVQALYGKFFERLIELNEREKHTTVRELDFFFGNIRHGSQAHPVLSTENVAFRIIAIDVDGNISSFSPELLTMKHERFKDFRFGNVVDTPIASIAMNEKFLAIESEIRAGVERCERDCTYYQLCGGGAPVNKLYETGRFDTTETLYCRLKVQELAEVVMRSFESRYGIGEQASRAEFT